MTVTVWFRSKRPCSDVCAMFAMLACVEVCAEKGQETSLNLEIWGLRVRRGVDLRVRETDGGCQSGREHMCVL